MRNLKKILALVLALVMSFSLMATANAFTDDEQITDTYETAVTVLDGLKVFQGYDDGSFQPQSPIRRSEVAAIIYRIVTGDVTDAQVGIYADYNKFDDVKSTSWYAGYVNFCANAEYIKGRDARTFDPDSYVTGYEALAMILRAIGYDKNGEFTGSSWQVQTAATGELRGITKNISEGTLGTYANREVVAEILFQTILVDKVNYTPAFGYQLDDTSLGWDTFELEEISGVVVANEYADLYSISPLKAGKTELDVDGDSYTLNYSTELTDIGEARHAYITGGENVLYIADAGNTVFETGAATDIEKDKDFEKATGLERDDATEDFINFDDGSDDIYETDILINYSVEGDATDLVTIKAGDDLTPAQYNAIKDIFTDDDYAEGWVVVGTKYTNAGDAAEKDISNDITFRNFVKEYLVSTSKDTVEVTESDNGEWLKVIDNDGDGVADYVFLTEFAMSVIERITKDGEYYLADLATADDVTFVTDDPIDGDDIITEDELAEDDVVIYTLIDGNYYMSIAEMVTETIDKKGINSKTETITCDGTDYVQSHIGYGDAGIYESDVTDAHTEETYDLYLDHFGYVRLYVESDYNVFLLLTDGYYTTNNRTDSYQATIYDVDANELTDIDVNDADDVDEFIADWTWHDDSWGNLLGADCTYLGTDYAVEDGIYATNIAGYAKTDDGYTLKLVDDSTSRVDYAVQGFDVTDLDERYLEANTGDKDIQTTTNTQYYLVIRSAKGTTYPGWEVAEVISWTGYKNAPADAELVDAVGYAVTHPTKVDTDNYNVADVVVFESLAYDDRDTFFVYQDNNHNPIEYVWGIGYDAEGNIADDRIDIDGNNYEDVYAGRIEFYVIDEDGDILTHIDRNYASYDIYAGIVDTGWDVEDVDYIQVNGTAAGRLYIEEDANVYNVTVESDGDYDVDVMSRGDVNPGDYVILFTDGDDNVEYAVYVGPSVMPIASDDDEAALYEALYTLWLDIYTDEPDAPTVTFYGKPAVAGDDADFELEIAYAVANAAMDPNGIFVENGAIVMGDKTTAVSEDEVVYEGTILGDDGEYYTFQLTQRAAGADATLLDKKGTDVTTDDTEVVAFAIRENWTIQEFVYQYRLSDTNATIEWTFTTNAGTEFSFSGMNATGVPAGVTTTEIAKVVAVVTPENDDESASKTYMEEKSAQEAADEALDAAQAAAVAEVKEAIEAALTEADFDPAKAMADSTTTFTFAGGTYNLKGVIDTWTAGIQGEDSISDVEDYKDAALDQVDDLVKAYVKAYNKANTPEPEADGIEVVIVDTTIYTANDADATYQEIGAAMEAALEEAGYTDVDYNVDAGSIWGITAKMGGGTVTFTLVCKDKPNASDVAFLSNRDNIADAISADKKTIYLATGTYDLTNVTLDSDITLIGNGDVVIETATTKGSGAWALKVADKGDVVIKNVTFVNTSKETNAIAIKSVDGGDGYAFEIADCDFIGYSTAIQLQNSTGGSITGCYFDSTMVDISVNTLSGKVVISDNTYTEGFDAKSTWENIGIVKADVDNGYIVIEDNDAWVGIYTTADSGVKGDNVLSGDLNK